MEIKLILSGFGGQGVMLAGQLLSRTMVDKGGEAIFLPYYGPEQRGGTANCRVTLSDSDIYSPIVKESDVLIAFNLPSLRKFENDVKRGGMILADSTLCSEKTQRRHVNFYPIPATGLARGLGNEKAANIIMLGAFLELTGIVSEEEVYKAICKKLSGKPELLAVDKKALRLGKNFAATLKQEEKDG